MDIDNEIQKTTAAELKIEEDMVVADAHIQDDLGADSLALMNLAEVISNKYGIDVKGDDLVDLNNFGELVELVKARISNFK